jgi:hypothetical protein
MADGDRYYAGVTSDLTARLPTITRVVVCTRLMVAPWQVDLSIQFGDDRIPGMVRGSLRSAASASLRLAQDRRVGNESPSLWLLVPMFSMTFRFTRAPTTRPALIRRLSAMTSSFARC